MANFTVSTKYELGEIVFDKLSKAKGLVRHIIIVSEDLDFEYIVRFEEGGVEPMKEFELLNKEEYETFKIINNEL